MAEWRVLRAVALVLLAVRLALLVLAQPFMDETYYWLWGQHPALSYFDHPALIGWTQGLASLFGWNIIALRLPVFLTLIADIGVLQLIAMRLGGDDWRRSFWLSLALFLSTPIFVLVTSVALPDHLLVLFTLLAVYAVASFHGTGRTRFLYLAGLAIGLATLSKYTGAFLGAGLVVYALAARRDWLRLPHLWLALLLAVALQAPVLLWNIQNGLASFRFIFSGRSGAHLDVTPAGLAGFALGALAVLSPVMLVLIVRFASRRDGGGYARAVFWLSTIAFLAASLFTDILVHWNAIAYLAVLPFVALALRSRWLIGLQIAYGVLALGLAAVNFSVAPVTALVGYRADQTSEWSYGWDEIAAQVDAIRAKRGAGFVAATDYTLAGPLGFALHDANVTSLSARREQFDFWFDPASHRGQSAVIVADFWRPLLKSVKAQFGSVRRVKTVKISRFGKLLGTYKIYVASDFGAPKRTQ